MAQFRPSRREILCMGAGTIAVAGCLGSEADATEGTQTVQIGAASALGPFSFDATVASESTDTDPAVIETTLTNDSGQTRTLWHFSGQPVPFHGDRFVSGGGQLSLYVPDNVSGDQPCERTGTASSTREAVSLSGGESHTTQLSVLPSGGTETDDITSCYIAGEYGGTHDMEVYEGRAGLSNASEPQTSLVDTATLELELVVE